MRSTKQTDNKFVRKSKTEFENMLNSIVFSEHKEPLFIAGSRLILQKVEIKNGWVIYACHNHVFARPLPPKLHLEICSQSKATVTYQTKWVYPINSFNIVILLTILFGAIIYFFLDAKGELWFFFAIVFALLFLSRVFDFIRAKRIIRKKLLEIGVEA